MRRALALGYCLLLAGILCVAQQERVSAFWQSRDSNYNVLISGGGASLSCSYTPITAATYNVAYTGASPSGSGGTPAYTFSQTGTLPPGFTLNTSTGVISGTDTVDSGGATYPGIQVKVTDSVSANANCGSSFTITVSAGVTAMTTPILGIGQNNAGSTTVANYYPLFGGVGTVAVAGAFARETPVSVAGTFSSLIANFPSGVGSGSYAIQVTKNGATPGTTLNCTVSSGTQCTDTTAGDDVTVSVGDTVGFVVTPSSSPTSNTSIQISMVFISSGANQSPMGGISASPSTSAVNYASLIGFTGILTATEVNYSTLIPIGGTVDQLYIKIVTAPGLTAGWQYVVFQNGAATSLTCSIASSSSAVTCNDVTHSITVSANDVLSLAICPGTFTLSTCTPSAAPTASGTPRWGVRWQPTTTGDSILSMADQSAVLGGGTQFAYPNLTGTAGATEANVELIAPNSFTIQSTVQSTNVDPGSGKTHVFTLREGTGSGQSNNTPTCTITGNGSTGLSCNNATPSTGIVAGKLLDWQIVTTAAATATTWYKAAAVATVP